MQLGMVTYNMGKDMTSEQLIAFCKETGLAGVELRTTHAHGVEVTLSQSQAAEPWRLPIEIGIADSPDKPPRVERLLLNGRRSTVRFPSETRPARVSLDPNTWVLVEAGAFSEVK